MAKPRTIFIGLLVGLLTSVILAYAWFRPGSDDWLADAQSALDRNDLAETVRLADLLQGRSRSDYAHFIRGKADVLAGRADLQLAADPARIRDRVELGRRAKGHFLNAIQYFEQVPKDSSIHLEAGVLSGECFARIGNPKQAADAFRYVVKRQPEHQAAHRWLADIYFELGAMDQALTHLETLSRLDPDDGYAFWQIGHIHDVFGIKGEAIIHYREALKRQLKPGAAADVVRALGVLLADQGLHAELFDYLDRFPATPSRQADYLALRAECLWHQGRVADAESAADQSLKLDAGISAAVWLKARIHLNAGRPREAIPLLEKVLSEDAHQVDCREKLAQAYVLLGEPEKADAQRRLLEPSKAYHKKITEWTDLARKQTWDADLRFHIGETLLEMNRPTQARPWLQAALSCNPNHQGAKERLRKIGGVK